MQLRRLHRREALPTMAARRAAGLGRLGWQAAVQAECRLAVRSRWARWLRVRQARGVRAACRDGAQQRSARGGEGWWGGWPRQKQFRTARTVAPASSRHHRPAQ
eukprot:scaffold290172_cov24-Tisochrysis_lutea.AAC.2